MIDVGAGHFPEKQVFVSVLEQVALAWARAARVSTDERLLAAWRNAVYTG